MPCKSSLWLNGSLNFHFYFHFHFHYPGSTTLYLTLPCLCFFLLLSTMALLHSTSLYHGSILDSTYFYHFSTSYHQPTLALIVSTSLDVILLLSTIDSVLPSTSLYKILPAWLYLSLLYNSCTLFYLTLLSSTMALHHSIGLYITVS